MNPVLILKTGDTLPEVAERRGDFDLWIREGLGLELEDVRVVSVHQGESLPAPAAVRAVVVTGSPALVTDREPWSERAAAWLADAVESGLPTLGICYGHQLLAHALGGTVAANPKGREIGSVVVELNQAGLADPLFEGGPARLCVQASHVESVVVLPAGARLLAATRLDPNHAFAIGECAWGIQFHPEFDADIVRGYIAGRRTDIAGEGLDPDALAASTADSGHGTNVLRRFIALVEARELGAVRTA